MSKAQDNAVALLDYGMMHPAGFLLSEAEIHTGLTYMQLANAANVIRNAAPEFGWTLVAEPTGSRGGWLYRLARIYDDGREWVAIRSGAIETQLATLENSLAALSANTDGRTTGGKTARRIMRQVKFLREELADLEP